MKKKIIKIIFVIIWMSIIFCFSNQKADDSTKLSDSFISRTIGLIIKNNDEYIRVLTKPVRKAAHFTIYLILGLLVLNCFNKVNIDTIFYTIMICLLYAISDEIHQIFVEGRSCEVLDIFIDTLGSLTGCMLYKIKTAKK